MKRKLTYCFLLIAVPFFQLQADEFPWPNLGTPVVINPGAPGVIDATINAATGPTHFVLKRNVTYIYINEIRNSNFDLMVTAEPGEGALPIIKALGPPAGAEEARRPFFAQKNLYLKDLHLSGWDQGGNFTDNATVRGAADDITIVLKNIVFDFNRQNAIRLNARNIKLYIEDCIFGNQGISQRVGQGFAINLMGNPTPIIHIRNNTFYNMNARVIEPWGGARKYTKIIFENNTIANTGLSGIYFGGPDSLIVKNNLWVNVGIYGDAHYGNRERFALPHYYFTIDSTFVDEGSTQLKRPYADFDNNHFYLHPEVAALLPDSSNKATLSLLAPYLTDLMGENNPIFDQAITFTNFPQIVSEFKAYIEDFYNFIAEPAQMPQFNTDVLTLDFGYPTTHPAYSAASDGGPLGDRNWFPDFISKVPLIPAGHLFSVFPNPASDILNVIATKEITKIQITNILGQSAKLIDGLSGMSISLNIGELRTGIYFITIYNDGQPLGTTKLVKR